MKKIILSILGLTGAAMCNAQVFPTTQRSLLTEFGAYTCHPCYAWTIPMVTDLKGIYGDKLIFFKHEHTSFSPVLSREVSRWFWDQAYVYPIGGPGIGAPMMFVNHHYLSQASGDSVFKAQAMHTLDSTNSHTALASPIFTTTNVGTDSMVVDTKVKFLQATSGDYRVGVMLLQDSVWYQQTGAPGGYYYHMHHLSGPELVYDITGTLWYNGNDSATYTLANGPIAANTVFSKSFHFKLDTTQVQKNIKPVVIVWKYDTVQFYSYVTGGNIPMQRLIYVNANEKPGLYNGAGTPQVSAATAYIATIHPNPAANTLHVKLEGVDEATSLHVYDLSGRSVLTQQVADGQRIDISILTGGMYVYNFTVRGQVIADGKFNVVK